MTTAKNLIRVSEMLWDRVQFKTLMLVTIKSIISAAKQIQFSREKYIFTLFTFTMVTKTETDAKETTAVKDVRHQFKEAHQAG